jgi:membrane protein DedA with SNARE-associated domain
MIKLQSTAPYLHLWEGVPIMLVQIVEWVTVAFESIVGMFGLPGISLIGFLENIFPPTPSEYIYPLAGKMAHDYGISPLLVIGAGTAGTLLGALCFYGLGYWLGEERVRGFVARFGTLSIFGMRLKIASLEDYEHALELFERRGYTIVLLGRIMPYVHGIVSIPAGVVRMPLLPFLLYSAIGAIFATSVLVMFGYLLGTNWEQMLYLLDIYEMAWLALIAGSVLVFAVYRVFRARLKKRMILE